MSNTRVHYQYTFQSLPKAVQLSPANTDGLQAYLYLVTFTKSILRYASSLGDRPTKAGHLNS